MHLGDREHALAARGELDVLIRCGRCADSLRILRASDPEPVHDESAKVGKGCPELVSVAELVAMLGEPLHFEHGAEASGETQLQTGIVNVAPNPAGATFTILHLEIESRPIAVSKKGGKVSCNLWPWQSAPDLTAADVELHEESGKQFVPPKGVGSIPSVEQPIQP